MIKNKVRQTVPFTESSKNSKIVRDKFNKRSVRLVHWKLWNIIGDLVAKSCLTLCDPIDCNSPGSSVHGIFPGMNTEVACHFLLQGIFPTQGSNLGLLHCRQILYCPSHQGTCYERMRLINRLIWGKSYSSSPSLLVYMGDMVIFLCMHLYL